MSNIRKKFRKKLKTIYLDMILIAVYVKCVNFSKVFPGKILENIFYKKKNFNI